MINLTDNNNKKASLKSAYIIPTSHVVSLINLIHFAEKNKMEKNKFTLTLYG